MKGTLHKARSHLLISGICSLLFGTIIFAVPSLSLPSLFWLFAIYVFLKGIALSLGAWQNRHAEIHWRFLFLYGILNIVTGIVASVCPKITMILLGFIVSINLLMSGILQIVMASHLHKEIRESGWLIISGLITTIAGVYIYLMPRLSPQTILYLISAAALIVGAFLVLIALKAFSWQAIPVNQTVQP